MHATGWTAAGLGALVGAWLAFDGCRAMIVGDYVTPAAGRYAGRLGPWAGLLESLGIDPRSPAVKLAHVVLGAALLVSAAAMLINPRLGARCLIAACVAGLWYLPWGTLLLGSALVLLALTPMRAVAFG